MFGALALPKLPLPVRLVDPVELAGRAVAGPPVGDVVHRPSEPLPGALVLQALVYTAGALGPPAAVVALDVAVGLDRLSAPASLLSTAPLLATVSLPVTASLPAA